MNTLDRLAPVWLDWFLATAWQLTLVTMVVALAVWLLRGASPRLRHALWLVVLVKVFLPPGLSAPWSLGTWIVESIASRADWQPVENTLAAHSAHEVPPAADSRAVGQAAAPHSSGLPNVTRFMLAWAFGCVAFWTIVVARYAWLLRTLRTARAIDEGPPRIMLEQLALALRLRRVPELVAIPSAGSPYLVGVLRPLIVLPETLLDSASASELRSVLAHELVHWRRGDIWIGWLQVVAQGFCWHHPCVWWANRQLRHERECACDEAVLRLGELEPPQYGEALLRVLTTARGRSLAGGSLVGVFEPGSKLQERMEQIMNYEPHRRCFGWSSRIALVVCALLLWPLSPAAPELAPSTLAAEPAAAEPTAPAAAPQAETPYPQVVKTVPAIGAIDVDPKLSEILVTFDRDMQRGMSWTGGPPLFPPYDESVKPRWVDRRTCVLSVKLERGAYYRLGINSTSHQNFKDATGVPAPSSSIYFTTQGADKDLLARLQAPKIVSLEPANGATDVAPSTDRLRVTFDVPMGEGMSWTGGGPDFPDVPEGERATWSEDGLTCTLPVCLQPGRDYQLGLNSRSQINFQTRWGVQLEPVEYKFRTAGVED